MDRVEVRGMRIYAKHGCHEEERKSGGPFEVDVIVWGDFSSAIKFDDIEKAVDYVRLMDLAKEVMQIPKNLIETVAKELAKRVLHDFSSVQKTEVSIRKMKPPVDHDLQFVSTTITLDRTQN